MSMFCYQCQETAKNEGCTVKGVCGKNEDVANLQDVLIYVLKGISVFAEKAKELDVEYQKARDFIVDGMFSTITNVNFDEKRFEEFITEGLELRDEYRDKFEKAYKDKHGQKFDGTLPEMATWNPDSTKEYYEKGKNVGVLNTENEDIRSLRELMTYGLKGVAAYLNHARTLGYTDEEIYDFMQEGLAATTDHSLSVDELIGKVMKTGEIGVQTMALLDKANTETYGHPEPTEVNIGVNDRPGILVSGHDLRDFKELLEQTEGEGIDIYTHGEMLPANS